MMILDLHTHTNASKDCNTNPNELIKRAIYLGIDGIAITDHDSIANIASRDDFFIIPGIEVSSIEGHIICLGITKLIKPASAAEVIKKVHKLGGIAIAAHPYDYFRYGLGDLSYLLDFDAIELNGHCFIGNSKASAIADKHNIPLIGGSDSHTLQDLGSITTVVECKKNLKSVLNAIKNNKTKIVYSKNYQLHKLKMATARITRNIRRRLPI